MVKVFMTVIKTILNDCIQHDNNDNLNSSDNNCGDNNNDVNTMTPFILSSILLFKI